MKTKKAKNVWIVDDDKNAPRTKKKSMSQMTTVTMPSGANHTWSTHNKGHRCPGSETGHAITKSLLRETALKMSMRIQAKKP